VYLIGVEKKSKNQKNFKKFGRFNVAENFNDKKYFI